MRERGIEEYHITLFQIERGFAIGINTAGDFAIHSRPAAAVQAKPRIRIRLRLLREDRYPGILIDHLFAKPGRKGPVRARQEVEVPRARINIL